MKQVSDREIFLGADYEKISVPDICASNQQPNWCVVKIVSAILMNCF